MMELNTLARALNGEVSGGQVLFPPPGHSAKDRSAAVRLDPSAPDGFLVHCFAGDDPILTKDYVRARLGLPEWQPQGQANGITRPRVVAEYVYQKEDGTPYLRVQRTDRKDFWQSHWTGTGWAKGKPAGSALPYRLPELLEATHDTVFVVEGEKDADRLARLGFVATTNPEGAGKWSADLSRWLAGRIVHIVADNDEAGQKHGNSVAQALSGVAREVRVIRLPELPQKGDVSDWLDAGGTPERLAEICEAAPLYRRPFAESTRRSPGEVRISTAADLRRMSFPPVQYIVPGYIAEGCTLLAGRPKLGKSWLVLEAGLAVAGGGDCLGGITCEQGDVLYLALEDNQRRLQRRIDKVLGPFKKEWPSAFEYATEWPRANEGGLDKIREWITRKANPRLVIVDVLAMFKPVRGSSETLYEADYSAIKGLQALAGEFGIAIVVVHHTRKSGAESDPFEKVSGTLGLSGAADTTLILDRDGNGATIYGRGRDVEEIESAVVFDKAGCRWFVQGAASEVRRTDERGAVLAALEDADEPMSPGEIAVATGSTRNAVDQLLYRMGKAGEVLKAGRGRYVHPERADLIAAYPHTPRKKDKIVRSSDDNAEGGDHA